MSRRQSLGFGALLGVGAWVLGLVVVASPGHPGARPVPCTPLGAPSELAATVLHASPKLAIPTRLEVVGDFVTVLDAAADSVLHVVNRHTGALVRSLGRRGRGPGEFYGAWALDVAKEGEDVVWVYDLSLRRLTRVPLTLSAGSAAEPAMVSLTDGRLVMEPRWRDADTLLSAGLFNDARLELYDVGGRHVRRVGQAVSQPPSQPPQANQTRLALDPGGRLAALVYRYQSTLEIVEIASGATRTIEGPVDVTMHRPSGTLDRFAYVDVAATPRWIVALFSGRDVRAYGLDAPFGRCLHVFDWRGDLAAAFELDADALAIATESDGRFVYALRHQPTPAVIRFTLPVSGIAGPIAVQTRPPRQALEQHRR